MSCLRGIAPSSSMKATLENTKLDIQFDDQADLLKFTMLLAIANSILFQNDRVPGEIRNDYFVELEKLITNNDPHIREVIRSWWGLCG